MRRAVLLLLALAAVGCGRVTAPFVAPLAPSEQYARALADAGLDSTRVGRLWAEAGADALAEPVDLDLPGTETLEADSEPTAQAWRLALRRGEVLEIEVAGLSDSARTFVDLFAADSAGTRLGGWAAGPDTLRVEQAVEQDQEVVLRVWPEVLAEGTVSVRIETAPSLAFPVAGVDQGAIRSRWGAARDGGARSHQGIDVFADRGTPVVASSGGQVTRAQETPIGGLVVWLRPDGAPVSLYYAHLDRQWVGSGDRVGLGDTLGTVGNTGNAATTPPHLHFGVYGRGGAVDPEPFVVGRRRAPRTWAPSR